MSPNGFRVFLFREKEEENRYPSPLLLPFSSHLTGESGMNMNATCVGINVGK